MTNCKHEWLPILLSSEKLSKQYGYKENMVWQLCCKCDLVRLDTNLTDYRRKYKNNVHF